MSERVWMQQDDLAADYRELLGHPGRATVFRFSDGHREANVCCPGCGQAVFYLDGSTHPLEGPLDALSCPVEFNVTVCCGWRGRLQGGYWLAAPGAGPFTT